MSAELVQPGGAAQCLAVHGDHRSLAQGCGGVAVSRPGARGRLECVGVETLEDPPDRRPGRRVPPVQQVTAHVERGEQFCVGAGARSASSSMVRAPGTAAAAQTSRIEVSEYQRPRRERGSGTASRKNRRSGMSSEWSGPNLANAAETGEGETADTGTLLITWLRHLNDHGSRVHSVTKPPTRGIFKPVGRSWELAQALASPGNTETPLEARSPEI